MGPHLRMMAPFLCLRTPKSYLLPPSSLTPLTFVATRPTKQACWLSLFQKFVLPRNFIVFYHLNTLVFRIFFVPLHTIKALD